MELSFHRIDLARHEAEKKQFGDVVHREHPADVWLVPFSPLDFEKVPDFRHYRREVGVYIPLFPYLVPGDPTDALGFAFQLGAAAVAMVSADNRVRKLHLSLGHPVRQVQDSSGTWQFYLGFAFLLSR